jgi:hypothetical protein
MLKPYLRTLQQGRVGEAHLRGTFGLMPVKDAREVKAPVKEEETPSERVKKVTESTWSKLKWPFGKRGK